MPVTYEPWLVALSIIMAIQGAYVGLTLAVQVGETMFALRLVEAQCIEVHTESEAAVARVACADAVDAP